MKFKLQQTKNYIFEIILTLIFFVFLIDGVNNAKSFTVLFENFYSLDCNYIQFFYDTGDGFSEENSFFGEEKSDLENQTFMHKSALNNKIKKIRIDFGISEFKEGQKIAFDKLQIKLGNILIYSKDFRKLSGEDYELHHLKINSSSKNVFTVTGWDPYIVISEKVVNYIHGMLYLRMAVLLILFLTVIFCLLKFNFKNLLTRLFYYIKIFANKVQNNKVIKNSCIILFFILYIVLMYRNYIFGDYVFCIKDDPFYQVFAYISDLSQQILQGKYDLYSFRIGLGHENLKFYFNIFYVIAALFGPNYIIEGIIFSQCLKVFLSLMFFYLYLKKLKFNEGICIIGSLCFASSGTGIALGMFSAYTSITVFVAILLYFFELAFERRKKYSWFILVIPILLFFINLDYYFGFLWLFVLLSYSLVRFYMADLSIKDAIKNYILIIISVCLALLLYSPILYDSIQLVLQSDRIHLVASTQSKEGFPLLLNVQEIKIAVLRLFSPDILGNYGDNYKGIINYMDDPIMYSGILTLLLIPYSFYGRKKYKQCFTFLLGVIVLFVSVPFITYMSAGGTNYTFRMAGYVMNVIMIFIAVHGLNNLYNIKTLDVKPAIRIYIVANTILLYYFFFESNRVQKDLLIAAIIFLSLYLGLIYFFQNKKIIKKNKKYLIFLCICCFTELLIMTGKNVNNEDALLKSAVRNDYYNDGANDAISWIKANDKSPFFRIEKNFKSVSYNDALVQGYHGVKVYVGGANQSNAIADFYEIMDMPLSNNDSKWVIGFEGYPAINSFGGIKYLITNTRDNSEYGYQMIKEIGNYKIYKNLYAMPLGYMTHNVMNEKSFMSLSAIEKRSRLLDTCVIKDKNENEQDDVEIYNTINSKVNKVFYKQSEELDVEKNINIIKMKSKNKFKVIHLAIDCNSREDVLGNQGLGKKTIRKGTMAVVELVNSETNETIAIRQLSIKEGKVDYTLEFYAAKADIVRISFDDQKLITNLKAEIVDYDVNEYYETMREGSKRTQEEALKILQFDEDYISGNISVKEKGYMIFTIPYSKNWKCLVNGEEQKIKCVDFAFSGVYLETGEYNIELIYETNDIYILCFYIILSIGYFVVMFIMNIRKM